MTLIAFIAPSRERDPVAAACGIITVKFGEPMPSAWCHYCGKVGADTRDHVVARSRGGSDAWWNLVPAHGKCNRSKSDRSTVCECTFCDRAKYLHSLRRKTRRP